MMMEESSQPRLLGPHHVDNGAVDLHAARSEIQLRGPEGLMTQLHVLNRRPAWLYNELLTPV